MRLPNVTLAVALLLPPGLIWAQGNPSPDTQQEKNAQHAPPPNANAPGINSGNAEGSPSRSPDEQQGAAGRKGRSTKKKRNNAHQAHGTPKPAPNITNTSQ